MPVGRGDHHVQQGRVQPSQPKGEGWPGWALSKWHENLCLSV